MKKLRRSRTDRMIAGVCGGLGKYFGVDPVIIRLIFIIFALARGLGLLAYLLFWIIVPEEEIEAEETQGEISSGGESNARSRLKKNNVWGGIVLIIIGVYFLLKNLGVIKGVDFGIVWPVAIILVGIYLLFKKK